MSNNQKITNKGSVVKQQPAKQKPSPIKPTPVNNSIQHPLMRVSPEKAEKYRREGEIRLKEEMLKRDEERLRLKRENLKMKKQAKKNRDESWWSTIKDVGTSLFKSGLPLLMGAGDYKEGELIQVAPQPQSNSLLATISNGRAGTDVPFMHSTGNSARITHREYIGDIYSSTAEFSAVSFEINPGMNETFPWLSPIANQYTGYRLLGAVAEFVSEGSEYTNSAGLGYVAMAAQYNVVDPPFTTKRDMLNSQFGSAAKPSKSFPMWLECKPQFLIEDSFFIRSGSVPASADPRLYDLARLNVAVGGNTVSDVIIGELWLTYDVELILPISTLHKVPNMTFCDYTCTGVTNASPFGTNQVKQSRTNMDLLLTDTSLSIPALNAGVYMINITWASSSPFSTATILPTYTATNNGAGTWTTAGVNCTSAGPTQCSITLLATSNQLGLNLDFITAGSNYIFGTGTCFLLLWSIPSSSIDEMPTVFDPQGRSRSSNYRKFMERIAEKKAKDDAPVVLRIVKSRYGTFKYLRLGGGYFIEDSNGRRVANERLATDYDNLNEDDFARTCLNAFYPP